ncbi:MAG: hypothetical protein JSR24_19385 [Proteobacteria bacterium]|nr:hypothetical protein [Pseudomonadota bacterium]
MPLTFKIDHDRRFVQVDTESVVTLDEVLVYYEGLVTGNAMSYPKLFDTSNSVISLSSEELMTLGAWVSAFAEHDPRGPIALLCTTEENENTLRRYMSLGRARRPIKLFKSRTRAMKWLSGESEA